MHESKIRKVLMRYINLGPRQYDALTRDFAEAASTILAHDSEPTDHKIHLIKELRGLCDMHLKDAKAAVEDIIEIGAFIENGPKLGDPIRAGLLAIAYQMEYSAEAFRSMADQYSRGDYTAERVIEEIRRAEVIFGSRWLDFSRTADSMEENLEGPGEVQLTLRWENIDDEAQKEEV